MKLIPRVFPWLVLCELSEGEQKEIKLGFSAPYYTYTSSQAALNLSCDEDTFIQNNKDSSLAAVQKEAISTPH